ncbi:MAG: hypothetical protein SFX72_14125 [Isosphaeraceae bacterium]|nr:hypothetical protein [Isosphaeraceae bacterium]
MRPHPRLHVLALAAFAASSAFADLALAGGPLFGSRRSTSTPVVRYRETAVVVGSPADANAPTPMLGSFYATPMANVRGNSPTGGGYSPHGQYGINNLDLYGPLSIYRSTAVPVTVYSRGYDGAVVATEAVTFSTPNLPEATQVVNPTPASYRDRPRPYRIRTSWPSAINWIDQN